MAHPRQEDRSTQDAEETVRRTSERTLDQTSRIGRVAAETGEDMVRASANLLQQNVETLQNAWRFGLDMTTAVMGRSVDQLGRTLGVSGAEAQQAAERSARNAETILYSTSAASNVLSGMSRECFELVRHQIENSIDRMNDLWRCRTPQDFVAVQSDLVRDSMGTMLESNRRIADMSLKAADDTAKHMTQTMERIKRAA
jgi:phasin family protein